MLCHLWWCKVAVQEGRCMCCSSGLFAFGLPWLKAIMSFGTGCNRFQQNLNHTCQFSFYPELMQRIHLMNYNCLEKLMMRLGFVQMFSKVRINALWVKSGNRGNLKCLKVNNHFALIFYRKFFISFLSDAKLPKVYDWFLGLIIHVKYLRSYLQKTWRGGLLSLKFCTLAN